MKSGLNESLNAAERSVSSLLDTLEGDWAGTAVVSIAVLFSLPWHHSHWKWESIASWSIAASAFTRPSSDQFAERFSYFAKKTLTKMEGEREAGSRYPAAEGETTERNSDQVRRIADLVAADPELLALLLQKISDRMGSTPSPPPPPPPQHVRVTTLELALTNMDACVSYDSDGYMKGVNGYDPYDSDNEARPIRSTISFVWSHCVTRDGTQFVCSGAGIYRIVGKGKIAIFAGSEDEKDTGCKDGVGTEARFSGPGAIAECPDGNLVRSSIPPSASGHPISPIPRNIRRSAIFIYCCMQPRCLRCYLTPVCLRDRLLQTPITIASARS